MGSKDEDENNKDKAGTKKVQAEPGLSEQETEQMQEIEEKRKSKDAPGGPGHLTDSERMQLTLLRQKVKDAKEQAKQTKEEAKDEKKTIVGANK